MTERDHGIGSKYEPNRDQDGTVGSSLDEVDYKYLGRRILIGKRGACREGGLIATAVSLDVMSMRLVVKFSNGCTFTVPSRSLHGLAEATAQKISTVELKEQRLVWSGLGVQHAVPALMLGQFSGRNSLDREAEN